jgi:hypothetical protein
MTGSCRVFRRSTDPALGLRLVVSASASFVAFAIAACGGGGTFVSDPLGLDKAPLSSDTPPSSVETPPSSVDSPSWSAATTEANLAPPGLTLCGNPSAAQRACFACQERAPQGSLEGVVAACRDFYACFASCECSDGACITSCRIAQSTSCQSATRAPVANEFACLPLCESGVSLAGYVSTTAPSGEPPDVASCEDLALCCDSFGAADDAADCEAVARSGDPASCATTLDGYRFYFRCG